MKIKNIISILFLVTAITAATPNSEEGRASLQFLKLGKSAKGAALGDAYVSVPGDISALFYNPAGVYNYNAWDASLTYSRVFLNTGVNLLNAGGKVKAGQIGDFALGLTALISGKQQSKTISAGEIVAGSEYSSSAFEILGGYSRGILSDSLMLGLNLKAAIENLSGGSISGAGLTSKFVVDTGLIFNFGIITPVLSTLNLGVSVKEIGLSEKRSGAVYRMPVTIKSGLSYLLWINSKNEILLITEAEKVYSEDFNFIVAARYRMLKMISISFGYEIGEGIYGINMGLGYNYKKLGFTYSLDFSEYDQFHRFEVSYGMKAKKQEISAEAAYYAGQKYFARQDYTRAKKYFNKALSIDPEYEPAKKRIMEIEEIELKNKRLKIFEQAMETIE